MAERLKVKLLESDKLVDIVAGPDAYRDIPRLLDTIEVSRSPPWLCLPAISHSLPGSISFPAFRCAVDASSLLCCHMRPCACAAST